LLVQRQPEGSYTITEYGKLVLQLSSSLEFVFRHQEYFLTHDIWRLPYQFVNRLGELSQTSLRTDTMESISKAEQILREAEQYVWGLGNFLGGRWGLTSYWSVAVVSDREKIQQDISQLERPRS
jgi:hypothetical protein